MRVLVLGAGLIGVASAYFLRRLGHDVVVFERCDGVALETSYANGALLTPSMADPWNSPGSWKTLLASVGRSDSPLQLRVSALPSLAGWGLNFMRNSRAAPFQRNRLVNFRLAAYSLRVMESILLAPK